MRGRSAESLRLALVAGEVALSTLLLVGTGLLFHTLWNLEKSRLGFETEHITSFTAMPPDAAGFSGLAVSEDTGHAPASIATLTYKPVLDQIRHVPGVQSAALATAPPLSSMDLSSDFEIIGQPKDPANPPGARVSAVSGDYARTLGTPLVSGRNITDDDTATSPFVVVINEALAHKYFAGKDPLGKQINLGGKDTGMIKPYTIVGVLANQVDKTVGGTIATVHLDPARADPDHIPFLSGAAEDHCQFRSEDQGKYSSRGRDAIGLSSGSTWNCPGQFQNHARFGRAEHLQPAPGTLSGGLVCGPRGLMVIAGLYGVLSQLVGYRRREIGVRMALGASRQSVAQMVLRQGSILIAVGLGVGIALAFPAERLIKSFLYQVPALDAWTYAAVVVALPAVGLIAAFLPARKGGIDSARCRRCGKIERGRSLVAF